MKRNIRIAAVVCRCLVGQTGHNLERTAYWSQEAKKQGAELVCFPELNLTGYSNREEIVDLAIPTEGAEREYLIRLARKLKLVLLVGLAEKGSAGDRYLSHWVIGPGGKVAAYRKLHLAPPEVGHFRSGESLPVFAWRGLRFGIQLCYDAHFPELSTNLAQAGADVIFIPHASPRGKASQKHQSWMRHLPARAFDNGLFVVACNQTGSNGKGLAFPGNAVILSPAGEILTKRLSGASGLLLADLKTKQIEHVRQHRMRYFFPHRRPELYGKKVLLDDLDR